MLQYLDLFQVLCISLVGVVQSALEFANVRLVLLPDPVDLRLVAGLHLDQGALQLLDNASAASSENTRVIIIIIIIIIIITTIIIVLIIVIIIATTTALLLLLLLMLLILALMTYVESYFTLNIKHTGVYVR